MLFFTSFQYRQCTELYINFVDLEKAVDDINMKNLWCIVHTHRSPKQENLWCIVHTHRSPKQILLLHRLEITLPVGWALNSKN